MIDEIENLKKINKNLMIQNKEYENNNPNNDEFEILSNKHNILLTDYDILKNKFNNVSACIEELTSNYISDADMRIDILSERMLVNIDPNKNIETIQKIMTKYNDAIDAMKSEHDHTQLELIQSNQKINDLSQKLEIGKHELIFEAKQSVIKSVFKTIQDANKAGIKYEEANSKLNSSIVNAVKLLEE